MIILDTNVVSELMRSEPAPSVANDLLQLRRLRKGVRSSLVPARK